MAKLTDMLGVRDAAAALNLSIPRIKQLAAEGRIGKMIAGRYLFTAAECAAFSRLPRPGGRPAKKSRRKSKAGKG